jgi:hypothetical protein
MQRRSLVAGIGAIAFGVLPIVAFMVANPPGGNYKASDVADFIAKGHRPAVFVSIYLVLLSAVGLLLLLARLRESIAEGSRTTLFWGFSVSAVAAWLVGYAIAISPSVALAFSGGKLHSLSAPVAYTFSETGWVVMYGAAGLLLGCALLTFAAGAVTLPAWIRWTTLVAGIAALAAVAWFPFFLVYLWAIVVGVALVAIELRGSAQTVSTQPA